MAEGNYSSVQILSQLVCLLRKNGDKILQGDSKFCLTTQGLSVLNASFRRYSEIDCVIEPEYLTRNKNVKQEMLMEKWKENICFLHDFVVKTISLKIIHGSFTVQSPVILTRFRNLQCLEVKKVPVHMLEGLQILRSQLQTLIVSRCLQNIEALLETCGGDQSGPMSWPKLRWCSLNYNSIAKLDESLRLVNELEVLELSHNYICKTEDFLQYLTGVQRVNLGFNQIDSVPKFSLSSRVRLKTLVLRNNNLDNLEGIEELTGLEELDVSENCLSDHRLLSVLSPLHKLQLLNLLGNPLAYHDHHRIITVSYISHSVLRKNFFLDKKRVKSSEIVLDSTDGWCVVSYSCEQHRYAPNHRERWHGKQILNKLYEHIHITNHFITEYAFYAGNKERFIKLDSTDGWCVVSYDCEQHRYDEYDHKERSHDKILHSQLVEHFHITDYTVTEYVFYDEMRERYIDYQFQNKKRYVESKRPDCSNQSAPDPIISDAYMFNDTEDIAESLRVNSPSVSTTSKRKSRKKSKQFFRGSDLSFQEYSTDTSSRESSRAPSPDRSDLGESYNTKQKIEILRHHYGENWLQAYTTQHGSPLTTSENRNHSKETDTIDGVVPSTKDYGKTDDDFYLNDSTVKTSSQDDDFVVLTNCETNDKSNTELLNGVKEIAIDDETCVVEVDMEVKDVKDKLAPSLSLYNRLNSTRGVEWTRSDSEQQELYGPESDPFICHLMSSATDIRPVIISVNDRYIIEKDLNGSVIEMLDVKCMETLEEVHDYVSHTDFGDNILLPVIIISFDYVKKDRQNRSYIMEDDNSSKQLTDLLEPALNRKKAEKQGQKLQCLKCSRIFLPSEAKLLSNVDDEYISLKKPYSSSSEDYQTRYSCLSCKSGMVVRLVAENVLQSSDATPVGSAVSTSSQPESFTKQLRNSFLTSTPRNSPNHLSVSVGKSKTDDYSNSSKSNSEQKSDLNSTVKVDSNILLSDKTCYSTKMTSNLSLPDLRRASTGQIGVHQQSFPVEESDISVLRNPSQSSIAAISSTDIMTDSVTERDKDKNYLHSDSVGRLDRLTPVGSPLSTDVCSSMVSSVYENSLTVEGESDANTCTNSVDIYNTEDLSDTVKSAHHSEFNNTGYHSDEKKSGDEGLDVSANLEESVLDSPNIEVLSSTNDYQDLFKESNVTLDNSENLTLNTEEFTEVDHRLKLYFMMHLFEDDDDIHCFIECDIVQYKVKASFRGILLVSTRKIFILKIKDGDHRNEAPDLWLTQADCQPITEVQYVDIGLGYQSFRLEFSLENLCYTFIIRDEGRCKRYLSLFTGIVQSFAFDDKSKLKGISKYNATTSENLWQQVLWRDGESDDLDGVVNIEEEKLVKYLMAYLIDDALQTPSPVSLVITATELCLVIENHHYLPPHAIVDSKKSGSKGVQFQLKEIQKINNIATVELADEDLKQLRLTFFNEESSDECCWHIIMETTNGILSLVEAIRGPWESEFGIDLEVTKTSFCEESSF